MKVLFVVPFPLGKAASQRYRVEQFLPFLQKRGIKYKVAPFWDASTWTVLYKKGHFLRKATGVFDGFLRRALLLLQLPSYNYVFIHREATPVGPPWFEWIAAKVFRKKLIYDFDDAIWLNNTSDENKSVTRYKWQHKTEKICRWSYKVSVGNNFLKEYAQQFNQQVVLLPSAVDLINKYNKLKNQQVERITVGWIGSHSTLPYLKLIEPALQRLEKKHDFDFIVIADRSPELRIDSMVFVPWNQETEVDGLLRFSIGVMPLPDTEWARGKCAFKAIQYMALGIPAIVSAVGANTEAVLNGETGYTCTTEQEWYESLERLLTDPDLRAKQGEAGRAQVEERYALQAYEQTFVSLFS
ncbi:glycosyltransferase family 4 protein [Pontibacter locisalis]|uniref:Glycosyltransferase family 4 protein n=1 Tax=Pontibacter locisalis TaxID=1719035 RepID=A0ABW5IRA4_9BACT